MCHLRRGKAHKALDTGTSRLIAPIAAFPHVAITHVIITKTAANITVGYMLPLPREHLARFQDPVLGMRANLARRVQRGGTVAGATYVALHHDMAQENKGSLPIPMPFTEYSTISSPIFSWLFPEWSQ